MAVGDVVRVLMEYYQDGEEAFERRHGSGAAIAARDMADLVRRELGGQLDYGALWEEFEAAPRETRPALTGGLEALVEADPGLGDKLDQLMQDYWAARGTLSPGVGRETPEAEVSEFTPRERTPAREQEAPPGGHADQAGKGAYLYGNVPAGETVSVGKTEGLDLDVLEAREGEQLVSFDLTGLFEQLQARIERDPALSEETRGALRQELVELHSELMLGDETDGARVVEHLRRLGDIDGEFLELVLTGLWHTPGRVRAVVEQAVSELRGGNQGAGGT